MISKTFRANYRNFIDSMCLMCIIARITYRNYIDNMEITGSAFTLIIVILGALVLLGEGITRLRDGMMP
jgi:hypothetical protein